MTRRNGEGRQVVARTSLSPPLASGHHSEGWVALMTFCLADNPRSLTTARAEAGRGFEQVRSPWAIGEGDSWEGSGPLMQVQKTFATDDIGGGGTATGMGSLQDMAVESRLVVAGRSGVGRSDGGALSVGHIGVKGSSVHRSQQGDSHPLEGGEFRLGTGRKGTRRALPKSTMPIRPG